MDSWRTQLDFTFDIESTNLPAGMRSPGRYRKDGSYEPGEISKRGAEAYRHADLTEFGYITKDGRRRQTVFTGIHSTVDLRPIDKERDATVEVFGKKQNVKKYTAVLNSEEEILDYGKEALSLGKINKRQYDYYEKHIAPRAYNQGHVGMVKMKGELGQDITASSFSHEGYLKNERSQVEEKLKKTYGIGSNEYGEMPLSTFYNGKDSESLYTIMEDLLHGATPQKPKTIGAWNIGFDFGFVRDVIERSGNIQLAQRLDNEIKSGAIKLIGQERDWMLIAYRLVKENPDMADNFRIAYHPEAFIETKGRSGQMAKTLEEFRYSVAYSENKVMDYFKWFKPLQKETKGLSEAHHSLPDTGAAKNITEDLFNRVKDKAREILGKKGLTIPENFEDFVKSDAIELEGNVMEQAILELMGDSSISTIGNPGDGLRKLKAEMSKDANNITKRARAMESTFAGSKMVNKTRGRLLQYGGIALTFAAILAGTYASNKKETDVGLGKKLKRGHASKSKVKSMFNSYAEGGDTTHAHYTSLLINKLLPGFALPALAIYGVGAFAATKDGAKLGVQVKVEDDVFAYARSFLKTMRRGVKEIERAVPTTRLFRVGPITDYLAGDRNLGIAELGQKEETFKSLAFHTVKDGKDTKWAEKYYMDAFLDAAKVTNPEEAKVFESLLMAKKRKGIDKVIVRIATNKAGKAIVFMDSIDKVAAEAPFTKGVRTRMGEWAFDLSFTHAKTKRGSLKKGKVSTSNTLAENFMTNDAMKKGLIPKVTFPEYLAKTAKPGLLTKRPEYTGINTALEWMKWKLDLAPKGLNELANELYPEAQRFAVAHIGRTSVSGKAIMTPTTVVMPTMLHGVNKYSSKGLSVMWDYGKQITKEWPVPISPLNKFLETPFEMIGMDPHWIKTTSKRLLESDNPIQFSAGKILSFIERPHLGLSPNTVNKGLPAYFFEFGMKRLLPAALGIEAFRIVDHALGALTFSKDGKGPLLKAPIKAYEWTTLAYSKISDLLGLTAISKKQEKIAPGSTGIGIFAPAAGFTAATYSLAKTIYKHGPKDITNMMDNVGRKLAGTGIVKSALRKEAYRGALKKTPFERYIKWAVSNPKLAIFSFAMLPMTPLLPGLVGASKSYQERKAEYKGERDVAIRKYRGWILSSSSFAGGKAVQFRKHALPLIESDWENKVIWPSYGQRLLHNVTGGMFGRYMLENYHKQDQPVYESAPYGASVPLIGPLIAGTIGKILKPTVHYNMSPQMITHAYMNETLNTKQTEFTGTNYSQNNGGGADAPGISKGKMGQPMTALNIAKTTISAVGGERSAVLTAMELVGFGGAAIGSAVRLRQAKANIVRIFNMVERGEKESKERSDEFDNALGLTKPRVSTYDNDRPVQIKSPSSYGALAQDFTKSFSEFAGFKGFTMETIAQFATGKRSFDEFTPYRQSAQQFYNPAGEMWQYQAGDVSVFGGEFLRRIFQSPNKKWEINNNPNDLTDASWVPKKFKIGTTFDKIPMGWLYGSKKGWEQLFPEVKGMDLEQYPDPIRLEILKQLAPESQEFSASSERVLNLALNNSLSPKQEQRYYDTLDQVRQLKTQVYGHAANYAYSVGTDKQSGRISSVNPDTGEFQIEGQDKNFRIAGIGTREEDIRASLLKKKKFNSTQELDNEAREIKANMDRMILDKMNTGAEVTFRTPGGGSYSGVDESTEAIVGGLNQKLLDTGAPLLNTGNLSMNNMQQDNAGFMSKAIAKYWETLTSPNTFFNKKFISNRDYLKNYYANQVYNREVKLWSHPIKHLLEPFVASSLKNFGIDIIPSFTKERRANQQYWDVIKYIKYKMLANKSTDEGNQEEAEFYHQLWRGTMVGADPTNSSTRDMLIALPGNERSYFNFFANEADPKKRGKIYDHLPSPAKRLYNAIWSKQQAANSDDPKIQEAYQSLKESEGYVLNESEEEEYKEETDGHTSKGDWARARFVQKYAEEHKLPGLNWQGWNQQVDLENVELLALKEQGEQIQDYGYFDNKARDAAFDSPSFRAAVDLKSSVLRQSALTGTVLPYLQQSDRIKDAKAMPTSSIMPYQYHEIETNGHDKTIMKSNSQYLHLIDDALLAVPKLIKMVGGLF